MLASHPLQDSKSEVGDAPLLAMRPGDLNPIKKGMVREEAGQVEIPTSKEELASGEGLLPPPSVEEVREEVKADPHSTPASILRFASSLGPQMELAFKSEEAGTRFFRALEDCVLGNNKNSPISIQAICLSNAAILGRRYANLQPRYEALMSQADSQAIRLSYVP